MEAVVSAIGWVGAGFLLAAYAPASARRIRAEGPGFQLMNLLGASALTLNSGYHGAWPSAVLKVAWIAIGVAVLARRRLPVASRDSDLSMPELEMP